MSVQSLWSKFVSGKILRFISLYWAKCEQKESPVQKSDTDQAASQAVLLKAEAIQEVPGMC